MHKKTASVSSTININKIVNDFSSFIGKDSVAIIDGDLIINGLEGNEKWRNIAYETENGLSYLFICFMDNPIYQDVLIFNKDGTINAIEEKSSHKKSNYSLVNLYFYDYKMISAIKKMYYDSMISIIDLYNISLKQNTLDLFILDKKYTYMKISNPENIYDAAKYVQLIEKTQHRTIACLEEIAFNNGWISVNNAKAIISQFQYSRNAYGKYFADTVIHV